MVMWWWFHYKKSFFFSQGGKGFWSPFSFKFSVVFPRTFCVRRARF
jgi:hypothetical protein